ncbi:MAG: alpha/beta hydrolase [Anaerolineales bacterium]|nr:alpha/beta hydrolase [Anaerolineales bacterium]MCB0006497.1 alpha/beta hydrolase [Anaerolineales bacterium]MCB0010956.1 alpha/beta hydrolase [Anaerolineales bacterium]MCB0018438.1 alpha/beta hydrolase [Anaerolineales bacterium]MCB0028596.1 alpha/beta hydrolase [Anaerolineales bacterium]
MYSAPDFPDCPPVNRYHTTALGIPTSYTMHGHPGQPTLLLLHGMSSSADSFRELIYQLGNDYRLIAPDIPGFGYSADMSPYTISHLVEWLAAFVTALDLHRPVLLGHSFGGVVVTAFAHRYPEYCGGLVLLAPALLAASRYPEWARNLVNPRLVEAVTTASLALSRRTVLPYQVRAPFYDPAALPGHIFSRRTEDYLRARASAQVLSAVMTFDVMGILPDVAVATQLIWGENDMVVLAENAPAIAELMPDVRGTLILPECGHVPATEKTAAVAAGVHGFMAARRLV